MKRRLYLIAALALINVVIMKYHDYKNEKKGSAWALAGNGQGSVDSHLSSSK